MDSEMRSLINKFADQIRAKYNIKIPIHDIETEVVEKIGGKLVIDKGLPYFSDGYIIKVGNNSFEIHIPKIENKNHNRMKICRLLGYLFLEMGYELDEEMWNKQTIVYG